MAFCLEICLVFTRKISGARWLLAARKSQGCFKSPSMVSAVTSEKPPAMANSEVLVILDTACGRVVAVLFVIALFAKKIKNLRQVFTSVIYLQSFIAARQPLGSLLKAWRVCLDPTNSGIYS